jgi:hypothetical protein
MEIQDFHRRNLVLASLAQTKEPKHYQTGTLLQMDSAECSVDENSGKSVVGEMVETDSAHKKTPALLCYVGIPAADRYCDLPHPSQGRKASRAAAG